MFTADGKKLLKEKETGTPEEQLRSLASIKLQQEIKVEQDKIARCNELLEKLLAGNANLSALKTCQNILKLLKAYSDKFKELQGKVDALEEGQHLTTRNLLSDVNRLVINVPVQAQHRRTPIMPHEQDSRKKRKTPGPRRPEDKKGKRGRSMKVQKVAGSAKQPRKKKKALAPSRWQQEVPVKREPAAVAVDPARMFDAVPIEIFDEPSADAPFVDFKLEEQPMDDALREFLAVKQEPVRPTPPPPPVRIARPAFDFALPPDE